MNEDTDLNQKCSKIDPSIWLKVALLNVQSFFKGHWPVSELRLELKYSNLLPNSIFNFLFRFQWYSKLVYGQWILNASTVYVELQMLVNSIVQRNFSDLNQSIDLTINRSRKVNGWKYFCICVWKNALVEQASRQLVYIEWAITQNSKKCQNQWQLAQTIQIWHYLSHWLVVGSMKQETLRQGAQSPLFWGDRLEYD